jgi:hypothetical protein
MEQSKTERIWNFISMFVFVLCLIGIGILMRGRGLGADDISVIDMLIISIATYRMTRLVVYDRIFKLFRDILRSFQGTGIGDSLKTIVTCPWCAGVWISLFNVAVFYLVPYGVLFIYVMTIAGISTFLQIGVNILGLAAEERQMDVREKRKKTGNTKPQ